MFLVILNIALNSFIVFPIFRLNYPWCTQIWILAVLFQNLLLGHLSQLSSPVTCKLCPQARTPSSCHLHTSCSWSPSARHQLPASSFLHPQQGSWSLLCTPTPVWWESPPGGHPALWICSTNGLLSQDHKCFCMAVSSLTRGLAQLLLKLVKRHRGKPGWQCLDRGTWHGLQ